MERINIRDVSFSYDSQPVLARASLDIERGERLAVLGPNGAGKTTLLKLIAGVLAPSAGSVLLDGQPIRHIPRGELARNIGVVPQEFVVPFAFTAREIVELGRTPHLRNLRGSSALHERAVEQSMTITRTTELAHRVFNELSGGERRRVVIAMALAQEPAVLLLDEPTQQLDIGRQAEILDLISERNEQLRLTVVAAIHDLNLAARYFGRLVFLDEGAIVADGPPDQVLKPNLLRGVYGRNIDVLSDGGPARAPIVLPGARIGGDRQEQIYGRESNHADPLATS
jgi:iron complex transport system ATP-binding protein